MGMIEEGTRRELDFSALKGAIEGKDPDALLAFYAEDAQLRVENAAHPEGKAFELEGRAQIGRYLHAICEQELECSVQGGAVHGEGSILFVEALRYPDGGAVSVQTMLEVAGGLIVRQIDSVRPAPSGETAGGGR
jgi:ketosteroid isomerase-like protein